MSEGEAASERFYLPQLDGLRFVAFLAVFVFHYLSSARRELSPTLTVVAEAGAFGVDLFFVLSSFLITSLLLREHTSAARIHVRAFWIRRALRIWPLYFIYVSVIMLLERPPGWYAIGLVTFTSNWVAQHRWYTSATNHLWSIAIEEQFYLCWPLVLAWIGRRWLPAVAAAMIGSALAMRALLLASRANLTEHAVWQHTIVRLEPLALGILLAWIWSRRAPNGRLLPSWAALVAVGGGWVLVATLIRYSVAPGRVMISPPIWTYSVVDVILAGVLSTCLAAKRGVLAHPILAYLGKISYGLYVFHFPVGYALLEWFDLRWPLRLALSFGLTVAVSALSYRFVEKPFLRLKARFTYVRSGAVS